MCSTYFRFLFTCPLPLALSLLLGVVPAAAPAQVMDASSWRLSIEATAGGTPDNSTQLGVDPQASDGYDDAFDFFNPPAFGDAYVDTYFLHDGIEPGWADAPGAYATDIRAPLVLGQPKSWELVVTTNQGATGHPAVIHVAWPNAREVPDTVSLTLRDPYDLDGDGQHEYNMRTIDGFYFSVVTNGIPIRYPLTIVSALGGAPRLPGDVNGDGMVDVPDALRALQEAIGFIVLSGDDASAADIDHDGRVTIKDAGLILRLAVGLPLQG